MGGLIWLVTFQTLLTVLLTCFDTTTFLQKTTVSRLSRQNDAGLRALTVVL